MNQYKERTKQELEQLLEERDLTIKQFLENEKASLELFVELEFLYSKRGQQLEELKEEIRQFNKEHKK